MTQMDPMIQRMLGALRLDLATYEEVEADKKATGQAAYIVVASSLVAGAVSYATTGHGSGFGGAIGAFIGWAFYAWLAFGLGTRLFPAPETKASWGEVARTLGFANTPRLLLIFALIPGFAALVQSIVGLWVLLATIYALRAALDCSPMRAILIGIAAWFAQIVILVVAVLSVSSLID